MAGMNDRWGKARTPLICLLAPMALIAASGCHRHQTTASSSVDSIVASDQDNRVPGAMTVTVPARTGSQSSGTEGSSTVIGAPPKGQTSTTVPAH